MINFDDLLVCLAILMLGIILGWIAHAILTANKYLELQGKIDFYEDELDKLSSRIDKEIDK